MTMTIRDLLADLLWNAWLETGVEPDVAYCQNTADCLLADPDLAAVIDLAAFAAHCADVGALERWVSEHVRKNSTDAQRALLADWRANR